MGIIVLHMDLGLASASQSHLPVVFSKMIEKSGHEASRGMIDLGVRSKTTGPKCLFSLARRAVCKVVRGLLLFN